MLNFKEHSKNLDVKWQLFCCLKNRFQFVYQTTTNMFKNVTKCAVNVAKTKAITLCVCVKWFVVVVTQFVFEF